MASSQTTSFTEKKKETIIDGRLFVKSVVMERIQNEHDDSAAMAIMVSCIKQTVLFNLGRQHSELYDESLVEEFYQKASVRFRSEKKGGGVAEIFASIRGVEIRINRHLLEDLFSLPSTGLKLEELESFGSEDLLSSFWCVFIGDSADKKVHPSCHKIRFVLFVYLHDFCCRVVENRTGAFEMCTNLRFRMMVAIMFGEPVNWCQVILKRLQEEVSKPLSQKKSFGLILTNIFSCGGVASDLFNIANALQVLPQLIKVALSNIQQQKKEIMEKEQAKYTTFAARSAIALKASGTKLTGHDKNLDDLSLSFQTLADKFNRIKGKQDDVLDLVQSINSHVSEINARKGEEESREAAHRWRLQKEVEIDAVFEESITAAINRLGAPHQGYRVSGHRPEHHDPNVPWKQLVRPPPQINLPTDCQPSPGDIKQWKKTQLMRYFVKLIKESTIFDRCKTLAEAAEEFTARLEKGVLPLQLAMLSKHRKGDRITHP
ncbi:hypothetical protein OROHE_014118 [Orobanche hederae]